jgi:hypothetical protein
MSLRGHYRAAANVQSASFLIVRYGSTYCALPSEGVRGVLTHEEAGSGQRVTWVGVTYHDVNLAGLMGTDLDAASPDLRTVLYSGSHSHGAIRVDEVVGLVDVERDQCRPLPPHFRREERTWIAGMLLYQDRVALILNPEWVLGELGEVVSMGVGAAAEKAVTASGGDGSAC